MHKDIQHRVLFPSLLSKPLHVAFDEPLTSSDSGSILLKSVDDSLGLTESLLAGVSDSRQSGKVQHSQLDLLRQRVFGIASGYADANDVARLGDDPLHKLLLARDPVTGASLASQPTISRFENGLRVADHYRLGVSLAETVMGWHRKRLRRQKVRRITIDLDPTDDETHGAQQQALFNGHYGHWCYLPLLGFLTFNNEPDQYLFAALLRSGTAKASQGAIPLLRRTIARLRASFPQARIRVRLDGGFAGPQILEFLEEEKVEYIVGMAKNKVLVRRVKRLMGTVRRLSREQGQTMALFRDTLYAARSWRKTKRRIICKAEVTRLEGREPKNNPRFVVTNLGYKPETVYKIYKMRGDSENRIKELKVDLEIDRTSCTSFWANQLRVTLTAAAYVLFQALRSRLAKGSLAGKQVGTLRLMLFKIAGRVERSVRRVVIHLAQNHPWRREWTVASRAWGAVKT